MRRTPLRFRIGPYKFEVTLAFQGHLLAQVATATAVKLVHAMTIHTSGFQNAFTFQLKARSESVVTKRFQKDFLECNAFTR